MILTKEITIDVENNYQTNFLKSIGIESYIGDLITFSIEKLPINSHRKILVKCDNCGEEKILKYQAYNKGTNNNSELYYCSKKDCINLKRFIVINKKYCVNNVFQLSKVKDKIIETNLEKYGCENPQQNKEIKNRTKDTLLERYGCRSTFQSEEIRKKGKQTCLERYGVEYAQQSSEIRKKSRETCLERYGVEYAQQNSEIFSKSKKSGFFINEYENIKYQGSYELDFLKLCEKHNILDKLKTDLTIEYKYENENHVYHPDYYIEELNLVIEIKSSYWYNVHKEQCVEKMKEVKKCGYNYIMILDKNYIKILKILL